MKVSTIKPTEAELEILRILWESGPSTVRFINEKLNEKKEVGYTTTLKIMQIMTAKKLLERDASQRSHIYRAILKESETQNHLLERLMETAFGGSASKLVMRALGSHKTSKEELRKIRKLLDEREREEI